jgi:hypothetical protein
MNGHHGERGPKLGSIKKDQILKTETPSSATILMIILRPNFNADFRAVQKFPKLKKEGIMSDGREEREELENRREQEERENREDWIDRDQIDE